MDLPSPLVGGKKETADPGRRGGRERKAREKERGREGKTSRATSDRCRRKTFWLIINGLYESVIGHRIAHVVWARLHDFNKIEGNLFWASRVTADVKHLG